MSHIPQRLGNRLSPRVLDQIGQPGAPFLPCERLQFP